MKGQRAHKKPATSVTQAGGAAPACTLEVPPLPARIRILMADDHAVVREGLVALLNRQPDMLVVAEASNGREAVSLWQEHHPDVAVLDLRMPVLDGVGAIEQIRALDSSAKIIVLTTFDGDEDIYRGMRAGAKGYLLKDTHSAELLNCIRCVFTGEVFMPPSIAAKLAERIAGETLSRREIEVLVLLNNGQSNKEIGLHLHISETTVKTHVKHIFAKLHVTSRTEAIAIARRRGFLRL